jgi:hypothetical protein
VSCPGASATVDYDRVSSIASVAWALLEPLLRREAHGLGYGPHLLVARVLYAALAQVGDVGAGYDAARRLVELLARPPATVRAPMGVQQPLELLRDVNGIYDSRSLDVY